MLAPGTRVKLWRHTTKEDRARIVKYCKGGSYVAIPLGTMGTVVRNVSHFAIGQIYVVLYDGYDTRSTMPYQLIPPDHERGVGSWEELKNIWTPEKIHAEN